MDSRKLRMQGAAVVALVLLVGWPRYRPLPEVTVWRSNSPAAPAPRLLAQDPRVLAAQSATRTARIGQGTLAPSGSARARVITPNAAVQSAIDQPTSEAPAETLRQMGAKANAIVGRAMTDLGQRVPYARLLLRNTITGQIEARAVADQNGTFSFADVNPSGYVIEMVGADGSVLASSELVGVSNGDLKQTTIRISGNSTTRAIFGNVLTAPTVQDTLTPTPSTASSTPGTPGNVAPPRDTNSPQL